MGAFVGGLSRAFHRWAVHLVQLAPVDEFYDRVDEFAVAGFRWGGERFERFGASVDRALVAVFQCLVE